MRTDGANQVAFTQVPPDQLAVISAGDSVPAGDGEAGHVAFVAAELAWLWLLLGHVHIVDLEVRPAEEQPATTRNVRERERDLFALELLDELNRRVFVGHGVYLAVGSFGSLFRQERCRSAQYRGRSAVPGEHPRGSFSGGRSPAR